MVVLDREVVEAAPQHAADLVVVLEAVIVADLAAALAAIVADLAAALAAIVADLVAALAAIVADLVAALAVALAVCF